MMYRKYSKLSHNNFKLFFILEFETILTSLELKRKEKNKKIYQLVNAEQTRIEKILQKIVDKESGKLSETDNSITEDNPVGRKFIFALDFASFIDF